jgi:hypothetical protein
MRHGKEVALEKNSLGKAVMPEKNSAMEKQ